MTSVDMRKRLGLVWKSGLPDQWQTCSAQNKSHDSRWLCGSVIPVAEVITSQTDESDISTQMALRMSSRSPSDFESCAHGNVMVVHEARSNCDLDRKWETTLSMAEVLEYRI
jgi:hypothetical protein